tara:strand:- start:131737 stop:133704 length:1968 start_codon:yes stop_codon:yes gene_type:complete
MKKLIILLIALSSSCQKEIVFTNHLDKKTLKSVYSGIVEIVVPKRESDFITYERKLPFDKLSFKERNDKFHSIGTAFFIDNKKLISAAHVFALDEYSQWNDFHIRTNSGEVFKVNKVFRYSSYHDLIEFDLESYPKKIKPLKQSQKVEIGDMVYAVGNAQGEGISTRGGQVASFTDEHFNGKWKFIRFSSPASPGNSGGPLVNLKGEVIGVIVLKNQSENLNYALPISELENVSTSEAYFYERNMRVQDGLLSTTEDWNFKTPLPSDISSLRAIANPEKDKKYFQLLDQFKTTFKKKSFPFNSKFRESLRFQNLYPDFSYIKKSHNLINWQHTQIPMKRIPVGPGQKLYHGKAEIFPHFIVLEKPKEESLKEFYLRPDKTMDSILTSLGAHRNMAGAQIPILSYGPSHITEHWVDKLGRSWNTSKWFISYDNSIAITTCTPHPIGVACILSFIYSSQLNEGYTAFLKENINELLLSYHGNVSQWKEFLEIPYSSTSKVFKSLKFVEQKNSFVFKSSDGSFKLPKSFYSNKSIINAQIGYDPSVSLGLRVLRWQALKNKTEMTGHSVSWFFEPSDESSDIHISRWRELVEKKNFFSGKLQQESDLFVIRKRIFKQDDFPFILNDEQRSKISAVKYKKCFAESSYSKQKIKTLCKKL